MYKRQPNVNTVIGRVRSRSTGLTKALAQPNTSAAIIKAVNEEISTPGSIQEAALSATAVDNQCLRK